MISALKRLTKRQDDSKGSPFPSGIAAIGQAMQKKFAKGVNYNSKLIIFEYQFSKPFILHLLSNFQKMLFLANYNERESTNIVFLYLTILL